MATANVPGMDLCPSYLNISWQHCTYFDVYYFAIRNNVSDLHDFWGVTGFVLDIFVKLFMLSLIEVQGILYVSCRTVTQSYLAG